MFPSPWAGLARNTDPQTSKDAAASIDANRMEMIVLEAYRAARNGLTQDELSAKLPNFALNSLNARLAPLVRKGYLQPIGKRKGKSGKNQRVLGYVNE